MGNELPRVRSATERGADERIRPQRREASEACVGVTDTKRKGHNKVTNFASVPFFRPIIGALSACAILGLLAACSGDSKTGAAPDTSQQGEALTVASASSAAANGGAPGRSHRHGAKRGFMHGAKDGSKHGAKHGAKRGSRGDRGEHLFKQFDPQGTGKIELSQLPPRLAGFLKAADTDGDGFITRAELAAQRTAMKEQFLKAADTNGDGQISPEERKAFRAQRVAQWFAKLDTNQDGVLTAEEVGPRKWQFLSKASKAQNGKVTLEELSQLPFPGRGHRHGGRGRGPRPSPSAATSG